MGAAVLPRACKRPRGAADDSEWALLAEPMSSPRDGRADGRRSRRHGVFGLEDSRGRAARVNARSRGGARYWVLRVLGGRIERLGWMSAVAQGTRPGRGDAARPGRHHRDPTKMVQMGDEANITENRGRPLSCARLAAVDGRSKGSASSDVDGAARFSPGNDHFLPQPGDAGLQDGARQRPEPPGLDDAVAMGAAMAPTSGIQVPRNGNQWFHGAGAVPQRPVPGGTRVPRDANPISDSANNRDGRNGRVSNGGRHRYRPPVGGTAAYG